MAHAFKGTGTVCGVAYLKKLRKVDEKFTGQEIDTTGGGDTKKTFEIGPDEHTITFEALGSAPPRGAKGAVNVAWGNGATSSMAVGIVTESTTTGSVGGVIAYTFTVKETDE